LLRGFGAARWVIPSVAAGYALREVGEFFRNSLLVGGDARALAWFEPLIAVIDFALGGYAVKRWGLRGALAVGPVVFLLYALGLHAAARRVLPVPYAYRTMAVIAAAAVALGVLGAQVHTGSLALDGLAHLALALLLPGALLAAIARSPEGRAALGALRRGGAR
jgi:hypothetical protein